MINELRELYQNIWVKDSQGALLPLNHPVGENTAFVVARENLSHLVTGVLRYLDLTHCIVHDRALHTSEQVRNLSLPQTVMLFEKMGTYLHQDHSNCQPYSN